MIGLLIVLLVFIGPRTDHLPGWARLAIVASIVFVIVFPAVLVRRGDASYEANEVSPALVKCARRGLMYVLVVNVCAFVLNTAMLLVMVIVPALRVVPLRYIVLAPIANLLLSILFAYVLQSWKKSTNSTKRIAATDQNI
jgi:hypothetical protein